MDEPKFDLKDSGQREGFSTGAVRDTQEGKGRYDLIPVHPLKRLAIIFEKGAKKYGDNNWRKGMPFRRFLDSAKRHLDQYIDGATDEDHLMQAAWNLIALCDTEHRVRQGLLPKELDNRVCVEDAFTNPKLGEPFVKTRQGELTLAPDDLQREEIKKKFLVAAARGYCTEANKNKAMDSILLGAVVDEIMKEVPTCA